MNKARKILFITQEMTPYLPESEMSNMGRHLPQAIQELGKEIRTFMPKWGNINERRNQLHEVIRLSGMNIIIDDTDHPLIIKVASIQAAHMQVYFIDNDDYFQQTPSEDVLQENFPENDERLIFYARGVLETVKKLRWCPDLIHCHGWITSLVPAYIKEAYNDEPSFRNSKIVYSLYGGGFKGNLPADFAEKATLKGMPKGIVKFDDDNAISCDEVNKFALKYADGVTLYGDDIAPSLIEHAASLNLPMLRQQESMESYASECELFYESIINKEQ